MSIPKNFPELNLYDVAEQDQKSRDNLSNQVHKMMVELLKIMPPHLYSQLSILANLKNLNSKQLAKVVQKISKENPLNNYMFNLITRSFPTLKSEFENKDKIGIELMKKADLLDGQTETLAIIQSAFDKMRKEHAAIEALARATAKELALQVIGGLL